MKKFFGFDRDALEPDWKFSIVKHFDRTGSERFTSCFFYGGRTVRILQQGSSFFFSDASENLCPTLLTNSMYPL